ncbi:RICIN domain-containing protein [Natrinema marinum]|uniref:RICIN domain-containing protein n=1 Tax=Natrinema marinum TaxID=2961598 RepID=UPI0020C84E35|nr:RICIN domain-containing protein [Natrinema marinum]
MRSRESATEKAKRDEPSAVGRSRRAVLTTLGTGVAAAAGFGATVSASSHEAEVWSSGGTWYADAHGTGVYAGNDMLDAIQAAVDGLTPGRTTKETVVVQNGGTVGPTSEVHAVDLPSYTTVDVRGTITVEDTGDELVVPIRAQSVESIEIPTISIAGNPRYGIWIQSCSDVTLGTVDMTLYETSSIGLGVRIDDDDGGRSRNVSLDAATIEGCAHHAVETYGVDGVDIGTVTTADTGGCGLLLNDTTGATVGTVDATNPDPGGGQNVTVQEVIVRGGARGVFGVSGSSGFTVEHVDIEGTTSQGILLQDCQNVSINGGTVRNSNSEGVRIDSRDGGSHPAAENVTVQNLRVVDDRANPQQSYGIRETGPGTANNAILNNDLRNAGTVADLEVYASSTDTRGNVLTGEEPSSDGVPDGRYVLENANSGQLLEVVNASTADGANVQQWPANGHPTQQWDVREQGNGEYVLENVNSGKLLEVANASTADGANVQQWPANGHPTQRWSIRDLGNGQYELVNVNSGKLLEVANASTADGANVQQWPANGHHTQRWVLSSV